MSGSLSRAKRADDLKQAAAVNLHEFEREVIAYASPEMRWASTRGVVRRRRDW